MRLPEVGNEMMRWRHIWLVELGSSWHGRPFDWVESTQASRFIQFGTQSNRRVSRQYYLRSNKTLTETLPSVERIEHKSTNL